MAPRPNRAHHQDGFAFLNSWGQKQKEGKYFVTPEKYIKFKSIVRKYNLMGTPPFPPITSTLQWPGWRVTAQAAWPAKLNCLLPGPFWGNFSDPWLAATEHLGWADFYKDRLRPASDRLTRSPWMTPHCSNLGFDILSHGSLTIPTFIRVKLDTHSSAAFVGAMPCTICLWNI